MHKRPKSSAKQGHVCTRLSPTIPAEGPATERQLMADTQAAKYLRVGNNVLSKAVMMREGSGRQCR